MARCEAVTKGKTQCQIEDASWSVDQGKWLCHVHHPALTFQKQLEASREERAKVRAARKEMRREVRRQRKEKYRVDPAWVSAPPLKF